MAETTQTEVKKYRKSMKGKAIRRKRKKKREKKTEEKLLLYFSLYISAPNFKFSSYS